MNSAERFAFDKRTREILEQLTIPFAIYQYIDKRVYTIALSQGFCTEFGFKSLEDAYRAMDTDMYRATHPDDKTRVADAAYRFAAFDAPYDIVYRTRTLRDSDYIILHAYGKSIHPEPGVRLCLTWYACEGRYSPEQGANKSILNQTLSHLLTEKSQHRAMYYDYMTGLPNIAYFYELAEAGRRRMREQGVESAILFFDLTGLKRFNRQHGFAEGDHLINAVATILARHFSSESCARFAQDHFAAFAPEEGLRELLDAVIADCAKANGGKTLPLRIGVYPDRMEAVEIGMACDRARLAADKQKKQKRSFYAFYDMDMMLEEKNRQEIIDNLDRAIEEGWIKVYYQPIVRATNGKVCDVEALARWDDPVRGLLPPSAFIPVLEEAMLIHKLDICVVKQVLRDIRTFEGLGHRVVPVSINFSRADFDGNDLVQEICALVDEAGVDRKLINIEITESLVGSDFDYMKRQIERFRTQGFQVWMDDFGSGYSSLDVLQSVKFDLIKFDMGFMKRLDEGDEGKIILTELMKMATSLGVDTICEGVETSQQAHFLREIGCSRLQGYYFMKPVPQEQILKKYMLEGYNGFEDPNESAYYDTMGRVNLYDLSFLANMDGDVTRNTFDTVPMGVMEVTGHKVKYVRSNRAFRLFMRRAFGFDLADTNLEYSIPSEGPGSTFMREIKRCLDNGSNRAFIEEEMADGSKAHSFARKIADNTVTGSVAFAIAVLSVSRLDENTTYADIARALAADYYNIFVIDLDKNDYVEYSSQVGGEELSITRRGLDFFESARRDTMTRIYEEDREPFLKWFSRDNVLHEINTQGVFTTTYRLIDTGTPMYVNMKITRMRGGNRLILGISVVDTQMKQQEEEKRLRQERISLGRIAALSPDYIVLYTVDPATGHYTQYSPSEEYTSLGLAKQGEDFFADVVTDAPKAIAPEDLERHLRILTKENLLLEIEKNGFFLHNYRLMVNGQTLPVSLRATMVEEDGSKKILLGVIHDANEAYSRGLEDAYERARNTSVIYTHIAQALARGYTDLYYVNMENDELIEYHTDDVPGVLTEARHGMDFFEGCVRDAKIYVHPEDQEKFVRAMNHDFLTEALEHSNIYEMTYRRLKDGRSFYVQMRVTRIESDRRFIVIAVSDIDELVRQRQAEERIQEERIIYARLHAITGNYICVYVVDPSNSHYREFNSAKNYGECFSQAKEGTDFFTTLQKAARVFSHPDDTDRVLSRLTRENIMAEIERSGIFTLAYRIMVNGKPVHFQLKAAMVEEKEGPRLIVGLNDIDAQVRQEEEYRRQLARAQSEANIDALTGVKNKHAYLEAEAQIDRQIAQQSQPPFAVVLFDVNDLKKVNDTRGHQAGDRYIRDACKIICNIFRQSSVFRIGGDEFVVIAQGQDYACVTQRVEEVGQHNTEAIRTNGIIVACGMARFEADGCVGKVFDRADRDMYRNKNALKLRQ